MRGGLDDALDKLARRDELRRRASGEASVAPLAVQELVEAIASVVGRNPKLEVTVGVEGVGDPTLLHFFVEDGMVRVNADSSVAARAGEAPTHRHADFDLEPEDPPADDLFAARSPAAHAAPSYDDRDRYDPGTGYEQPPVFGDDSDTDSIDPERFRSPFAATPPPPVPPQSRAAEQAAPPQRPAAEEPQQRGMPEPLPEPIPLKNVDSEETEQAAKRLAALLRDNPTLLRQERP